MKTADQAQKHGQRKQYEGKPQNISKAAVQALISELEAFRRRKVCEDAADNREPAQVNIGFGGANYNAVQHLGSLSQALTRFEGEFGWVAFRTKCPIRRTALAYAIEIAKAIVSQNLEGKSVAFCDDLNANLPPLDVPARFNVCLRSRLDALNFLSRVLYENFPATAQVLKAKIRNGKMSSYVSAEIAGALHIAHEIHRANTPNARDLKSSELLKEHLGRWADDTLFAARERHMQREIEFEQRNQSKPGQSRPGIPVVRYANA